MKTSTTFVNDVLLIILGAVISSLSTYFVAQFNDKQVDKRAKRINTSSETDGPALEKLNIQKSGDSGQ